MQEPKQRRARQTREQLLAAAQRAFAEAGYAGATIDDVARGAGCTKGAFYFHFASKAEAFLALLDDWSRRRTDELRRALEAAPRETGPRDLLRTLLTPEPGDRWEERLFVEFWAQGERSPAVRGRLARVHHQWRQLVEEAIKSAQQAVAFPRHVTTGQVADVVLALRDGLAVQGRLAPGSGRARASALLALLATDQELRRAG